MYDMLNLQQMRVLLAVREHGSLTSAATALHYGVPTVAHHIRTLEAHLQAELVQRTRTGSVLTPLGDFFASEIERAIGRIDRAEQAVAERRDSGVVTLRVGSFASIGSRLLPAAIAKLQRRGRLRVEVVEAEPTEVVRLLRLGEIHAGIIYDISDEPLFDAPDLTLQTLFSEPYQVLVSRQSRFADQPALELNKFQEIDWICSRNADEASDRVLRKVHRSLGADMRVLMQTDDWYMIHGLVAEGLGCALTTTATVDSDFDVILLPAIGGLGERRVSFVTGSGPQVNAVHWLGDALHQTAATIQLGGASAAPTD